MRLVCLIVMLVLVSGCAGPFPRDEAALGFRYPLAGCNDVMLAAARAQVERAGAAPVRSNENVCVTRLTSSTVNHKDEDDDEERRRLERQALAAEEARLRDALEAPFFPPERKRSHFGIALSGGGTKASSFSIGVLAGLADHELLDRADYLSTVSGGGYAAYFYYAHRLFPLVRPGDRPRASNADLFRDCVSDPTKRASDEVTQRIKSTNYCSRLGMDSLSSDPSHRQADIRYQAFLKCTQDLLRPGYCHMNTTAGYLESGVSMMALGGNILTFPFSNVANTLFDWGLVTSPSARAYKHGIGISYGSTLTRSESVTHADVRDAVQRCGHAGPGTLGLLDCERSGFNAKPVDLTFEELRNGLLQSRLPGRQLPFWIMNAAAPENRSVFGWLRPGNNDPTNSDMFEMTAVSHGSGRYGYVSAPPSIHGMSVLDSVAASAAFLDANQLKHTERVKRFGIGSALHLANLDWGYDIANYNVSSGRRNMHRVLPVGLYWLDSLFATKDADSPELKDRTRSVYIRLIDGGNAENLGAYSLLKRGVRTLLISDAAQDQNGLFEDVCDLAGRLKNAPEGTLAQHLYLPGLAGFAEHCALLEAGKRKYAYDMQGWLTGHPILFGCIRRKEAGAPSTACQDIGDDEVRLLVVKPAINFDRFVAQQMDGKVKGNVVKCHVRGVDVLGAESPLNCDSAIYLAINHGVEEGVSPGCPIFPQHRTARTTANSSGTLFVAYRELARQYIGKAAGTLAKLVDGDPQGARDFEDIVAWQAQQNLLPHGTRCGDRVAAEQAAMAAMTAMTASAAPSSE